MQHLRHDGGMQLSGYKEHGSKDVPAVIDITDQDQAKVSILSSPSLKKNTRTGGRGRGEEHNWLPSEALD